MEATKAENMVEHGAEIAARPPKTWFQSTREKAAVAERWAPFGDPRRGDATQNPGSTKQPTLKTPIALALHQLEP